MQKRKVQIKISKNGNYTFTAMEGFEGSQCEEKTKQIEILLGGTMIDSGKTPDYYKPDSPIGVSISL